MSRFTDKVSRRVDRMSDEQIVRLIENLNKEIKTKDTVLDNLELGILLADSNFHVVYYNKYLQRLLHIAKGRNNILINTFIDNEGVIEFINNCIEKHLDGREYFYTHEVSSSREIYVRIISVAMKDSDEIIFRFDDITFLNNLKQEFKKNESLAAMTTMAAGVAHEIKNPLASISIYLQLLRKMFDKKGKVTKSEAQSSLDVISNEIERLNKIAVDFLFAVKPMNVNQVISDLNSIVKKTAELCSAEIESSNVKLELNLAISLPKVFIDKALIEQCILNLVRNALQAMDLSKNDNIIKISTYLDGDSVKLDISDNGCGMSDELMARIFEPYYTTKAQGTGLGLTTIFKIMKEHKGSISVSSEEGKGSVFTMQLPVPKSERFKLDNK